MVNPEKQAFLLDDLSKQYENPTGKDRTCRSFKELKDKLSSTSVDVNEKIVLTNVKKVALGRKFHD